MGRRSSTNADVRTPEGKLRVVYVTEGTGVGGGHRDIFEHLNRLADRGHEVALYTLGEPPEWFPLQRAGAQLRVLRGARRRSSSGIDAIKVATWWNTAAPVWRASVLRGIPVYFVQDIETSYYPDDERTRHAVIDSYRPEFRYMTISSWNRERLRELGLRGGADPPGDRSRHLPPLRGRAAARRHGPRARAHEPAEEPAADARGLARRCPSRGPELCMFGIEPELAERGGDALRRLAQRRGGQRAVQRGDRLHPDLDARGLRAAAAGVDGDRRRGRLHRRARQPRLLPRRRELPDAGGEPAGGVRRPAAAARGRRPARASRATGIQTAQEYAWERRIDALEGFLDHQANRRRDPLSSPAGGA